VCFRGGENAEAEAMYRQALAGREKILGNEQPDTLASVDNLGSVLQSQGRYIEVEVVHRQAIAGR
jgi:hypothetical protein